MWVVYSKQAEIYKKFCNETEAGEYANRLLLNLSFYYDRDDVEVIKID